MRNNVNVNPTVAKASRKRKTPSTSTGKVKQEKMIRNDSTPNRSNFVLELFNDR